MEMQVPKTMMAEIPTVHHLPVVQGASEVENQGVPQQATARS
jgi:hypothetical protein